MSLLHRVRVDFGTCGGQPRSASKVARSVLPHSCLALALVLAFDIRLAAADSEPAWPLPEWPRATPQDAGLDETRLAAAREYALGGGGAGCIIRYGRLVLAWGDTKQRYDLKSTTKSFGSAALGLAVLDGRVRLSDRARVHHPTLGTPPDIHTNNAWLDEITILHLASQTAGFGNRAVTRRSCFVRERSGPTATAAPTGWRSA